MAGDASASIFEIPISASLSGGTARSDATSEGGTLGFGSYNASPITGSGNTASGGATAVPIWLWAVAIGGAYWLARKKG